MTEGFNNNLIYTDVNQKPIKKDGHINIIVLHQLPTKAPGDLCFTRNIPRPLRGSMA